MEDCINIESICAHKNVISVDFGTRLIKVVHDKLISGENKEPSPCQFKIFTKSEKGLTELEDYIKSISECSGPVDGGRKVSITGSCSDKYKKLLQESCNDKFEILPEMECHVNGFYQLSQHLTRRQLLCPVLEEAREEPLRMMAELAARYQEAGMAGLSTDTSAMSVDMDAMKAAATEEAPTAKEDSVKPLAQAGDVYPALLVMLGSDVTYVKVEADGEYEEIERSNRGGLTFQGLSSLLTGYKDFDELISMAEMGNSAKVDMMSNDLVQKDDDDTEDMYTAMLNVENDFVIYCMGKGVAKSKDDFEKNDLVAAVLYMLALDIVQVSFYMARLHNVKQVFFSGTLSQSKRIRYLITQEFTRTNGFAYTMKGLGSGIPFDFVRTSSFMAAIGALVTNKFQSDDGK